MIERVRSVEFYDDLEVLVQESTVIWRERKRADPSRRKEREVVVLKRVVAFERDSLLNVVHCNELLSKHLAGVHWIGNQ